MTRMRAPFSSFSRWLSDLSSVRIWERERNDVNTFIESVTYKWDSLWMKWSAWSDKWSGTMSQNRWDRSVNAEIQQKLCFGWNVRRPCWAQWIMQVRNNSFRMWEVIRNAVRVKKRHFSKCGSCLLREAMTKNNNTLYQSVSPPVETNNIPFTSSIISQKLSQVRMWKL